MRYNTFFALAPIRTAKAITFPCPRIHQEARHYASPFTLGKDGNDGASGIFIGP